MYLEIKFILDFLQKKVRRIHCSMNKKFDIIK